MLQCVYSKLLACGTSMPVCAHECNYSTFTPDCLLICPQTSAPPCLPSRLRRKKKKVGFCVTLNLKDKVQRGGWHNRRKGPSIQICPLCLFYLFKTGRPVPPGLTQFLCSLVATLVIRQATASKDQTIVLNSECASTGGQARVKTHIAVHQRLA